MVSVQGDTLTVCPLHCAQRRVGREHKLLGVAKGSAQPQGDNVQLGTGRGEARKGKRKKRGRKGRRFYGFSLRVTLLIISARMVHFGSATPPYHGPNFGGLT